MKTTKTTDSLRVLHPMQAFGVVSGLTHKIRVSRLEERLTPAVAFPHKHAFFHIVIPTAGGGWHEIDFVRHPARRGAIFVMKPAQVHSWSFRRGTAGYVIEFERGALPAKAQEHRAVARLLAHGNDRVEAASAVLARILALCEVMAAEYEAREGNFEAVVQSCVVAMLLVIARLDPVDEAAAGDALARFHALVDEHHRRRHDVEFYAEKLRLSAKALTMRVSRATGKAARTVIHDRVVLEAKRLLAYSDLAIGDIGLELGFEDPNYFARFFKGKAGAAPGAFRETARSSC